MISWSVLGSQREQDTNKDVPFMGAGGPRCSNPPSESNYRPFVGMCGDSRMPESAAGLLPVDLQIPARLPLPRPRAHLAQTQLGVLEMLAHGSTGRIGVARFDEAKDGTVFIECRLRAMRGIGAKQMPPQTDCVAQVVLEIFEDLNEP